MKSSFCSASKFFGAFFVSLFLLTSCEAQTTDDAASDSVPEKTPTAPIQTGIPDLDAPVDDAELEAAAPQPRFSFLAYNLKNWLTMRRYVDGERVLSGKPEDEKNAVYDIILLKKPDILGICEIGSPEDLSAFTDGLKARGLDYPYVEHTQGIDKYRTLALLSRFPLTQKDSQTELSYTLGDRKWLISRGILDVTVDTPLGEIRFMGCHLKSKREIPEADQAEIRLNEAILLRKRIVEALEADPDAKLVVYGDMNDTRSSEAVRELIGRRNSKTGLEIVDAKDDRQTTWTHHWAREDIYSRLDYAMVSYGLVPFIDEIRSELLYPEQWRVASDHRAIYLPFFTPAD